MMTELPQFDSLFVLERKFDSVLVLERKRGGGKSTETPRRKALFQPTK